MMRVAVIGVGHMGKLHARVYASLDKARIVGLCDRKRERAERLAAQYRTTPYADHRDLLRQVDAVTVAVPTEHHLRIGRDFLRHGVSVLLEKPISRTLEEADELIETAARSGAILQVGHLERFNPAVRALEQVVTQPRFFEAHRLGVFSPRSLDIDSIRDLMIHDLDVILWLHNREVITVSAVGIPALSAQVDIANARLEFADGCVANLTASRISQEKVRKLRFFQPHDYVSLDYASQQVEVFSLVAPSGSTARPEIARRLLPVKKCDPLRAQIESFLRSVRDKTTPPVDGHQARRSLALALRVIEQIRSHAQRVGIELSMS